LVDGKDLGVLRRYGGTKYQGNVLSVGEEDIFEGWAGLGQALGCGLKGNA
jgi:hypothetical protein